MAMGPLLEVAPCSLPADGEDGSMSSWPPHPTTMAGLGDSPGFATALAFLGAQTSDPGQVLVAIAWD